MNIITYNGSLTRGEIWIWCRYCNGRCCECGDEDGGFKLHDWEGSM